MCIFGKKPTTVEEIIEQYKTPRNILSWIQHNIWYISDEQNHGKSDYTQTPEETLTGSYRDGMSGVPYSGDCEDFVILAQACLEKLSVSTYILCVYTPEEYVNDIPIKYKGHAILCFELDGRWCHFSNWGLKVCWDAKKLEDIAPTVYSKGYWQECWYKDEKLNKGKVHLHG